MLSATHVRKNLRHHVHVGRATFSRRRRLFARHVIVNGKRGLR